VSADLVTWLRAALDEDEAAEHRKRKWGPDTFNKRCPRCHMRVEEIESTFHSPGATLLPCRDELTREEWETFVDAQPAPDEFRLAVIASTRTILDEHLPVTDHAVLQRMPDRCQTCIEEDRDGDWRRRFWPCPTLRLLVAPFASRAGFDPSWLD